MKTGAKLFMIVSCCLLILAFLTSTPLSDASDHKEGKKHFQKHGGDKEDKNLGGFFGKGHDKGNEATGQVAAWSLAAANLTVVLSLLLRTLSRFAPLSREIKNSIGKFNSLQKGYLMRFHYLLNPLILAIALLHWALSKCSSTSLPEWGIFTMCVIVASGIILKLKLCPKTLLRSVYKVHTQPVPVLILISILVIGHLAVD
jgi:hypothetical protein